jgi:hypothetical protein
MMNLVIFTRNLIIEDASGGILVRIDRGDAYVNFPVGRRSIY